MSKMINQEDLELWADAAAQLIQEYIDDAENLQAPNLPRKDKTIRHSLNSSKLTAQPRENNNDQKIDNSKPY